MPAVARFLYITIDAQDAERVADFWAAVLDTEREEELDGGRISLFLGQKIEKLPGRHLRPEQALRVIVEIDPIADFRRGSCAHSR